MNKRKDETIYNVPLWEKVMLTIEVKTRSLYRCWKQKNQTTYR